MALVIDQTIVSNQIDNLRAAMTTDPKMRERVHQYIRQALFEARREMMGRVKFDNGDPHHSIRSIRTSVYRKVLGGNINILTGKKAHGKSSYEPPRRLTPGQRGGNRMSRGRRTQQLLSYGPLDRGFILRFVNSGTINRYAGYGRNGRSEAKRTDFLMRTGGRGFRGAIAPRNWFANAAEGALAQAANNISQMIEAEAAAILTGNQ